MTPEETKRIQEGNVAIARFEGRKWYGRHTIDNYGPGTLNEYPEMRYHCDWAWLIPVIECIESIHDSYHGYFAVHIVSNSCTIQGTKFDSRPESFHPAYFADHYHDTKLLATYEAVVAFIQWYTTKPAQDEPAANA